MTLGSTIYNTLFRKSSTFALTILVGAYIFETILDEGAMKLYESINKGKLWHHIEGNYKPKE